MFFPPCSPVFLFLLPVTFVLSSVFLSFYISIDAFGLHIHIRLLKCCLSHWFPNAHWTPSSNQVHSAVGNLLFLFQGSGKKQLRPDLPPVAIEIRSVSSLVLENFCVTTFHALSVWC